MEADKTIKFDGICGSAYEVNLYESSMGKHIMICVYFDMSEDRAIFTNVEDFERDGVECCGDEGDWKALERIQIEWAEFIILE